MYVLVNNVQGNSSYALYLKLRKKHIIIMTHRNEILEKHSLYCVTYNVLETQTRKSNMLLIEIKHIKYICMLLVYLYIFILYITYMSPVFI